MTTIRLPLVTVSQMIKNMNRGFYMSVHVLLILLNKLRKSDKMRGLLSIILLFHNELQK